MQYSSNAEAIQSIKFNWFFFSHFTIFIYSASYHVRMELMFFRTKFYHFSTHIFLISLPLPRTQTQKRHFFSLARLRMSLSKNFIDDYSVYQIEQKQNKKKCMQAHESLFSMLSYVSLCLRINHNLYLPVLRCMYRVCHYLYATAYVDIKIIYIYIYI